MHNDLEQQIDALFAARDQRIEREMQARIERRQKDEAFHDLFLERASAVIKPCLERVAAFLRTKAVNATVVFEDERTASTPNRSVRSCVTIYLPVQMSDRRPNDRPNYEDPFPHLKFVCDRQGERVRIQESSKTRAGISGPVKLEEITEELIQQKVLAVVEYALLKSK